MAGLGIILMGYLADRLFGDPYWFPHPVRFIGWFIKTCERLLRKAFRSRAGEYLGGMLLLLSTTAAAAGLVYWTLSLSGVLGQWLYFAVSAFWVYTILATKCLADEAWKIYRALDRDLDEARLQLSYIVGRETGNLSEQDILRAVVETVAENTVDGIIAPMLYIFIGGPAVGMGYKAINTLDSMVGYKNSRYRWLGWASARMDDLVNYIPARITGLLMVMAAWLLGLDARAAFQIMIRDRRNHKSPNCGYPEAAAAGALGIKLGGCNTYFGEMIYKPTLGDEKRQITRTDIPAAVGLMKCVSILGLLLFSALYIVVLLALGVR